ncbi:MAG TPA: DUF4340 domain-containing protein [Desulfobulbaceae bacterium]|nr:DUF4340 domain-containing protein [Desulfobulbaceae bacterium]
MKKTISLLVVLLLVQLGLVGYFRSNSQSTATYVADEPLFHFSPDNVTAITIIGPDNKKVELVKKDSTWKLPGYFNGPADQEQVNALLDKLSGLKKTWPVATTTEAATRFKVAADKFERHIIIIGKEKTVPAELYVGTSPSFRKVHIRLPAGHNIMAVSLATSDAPAEPAPWLDKKIIALNQDGITGLSIRNIRLRHKGKKWTLAGEGGQRQQVVADKVQPLVQALTGLRVEGILGSNELPEYGLEKPVLRCQVEQQGKPSIVYRFGALKDENFYAVKRSDVPFIFKVAKWQLTPLAKLTRNQLLPKKPSGNSGKKTTQNQPTGREKTTAPAQKAAPGKQ